MGRCDAESETLIPTGGCFDDAYSIRTANTSSNGWGIQHEVTHTLDQAQGLAIAHTLKGEGFDASEDGTGRGTPLIPVDCHGVMPTMLNGANTPAGHMARSGHNKDAYIVPMAVAFGGQMSVPQVDVELSQTLQAKNPQAVAFQPGNLMRGAGALPSIEAFPTLRASNGSGRSDQDPCVATGMAVRRLTPTECERLQGFSDGYTAIPYRNKSADLCPDGPRYKALGNSWAVPCARWIGQRIQEQIA